MTPKFGENWLMKCSCVQLLGASPPDPLTRGSAPGPRWGHSPQTPTIGSRYRARHSPQMLKTKLRAYASISNSISSKRAVVQGTRWDVNMCVILDTGYCDNGDRKSRLFGYTGTNSLCIIRCLHSESEMQGIVRGHLYRKFQICGRWIALVSI